MSASQTFWWVFLLTLKQTTNQWYLSWALKTQTNYHHVYKDCAWDSWNSLLLFHTFQGFQGAPGEEGGKQQNEEELNLNVNSVVTSLLTKRLLKIQQHQDADPVLQLVKKYALEGWPTIRRVEVMVQPYLQFAGEFKVENGLLFKGCRLVIAKSLQSDILEKNHTPRNSLVSRTC